MTILVVTSKVKEYVRQQGDGMRLAGDVAEKLSEMIEKKLDGAIAEAKAAGRETLKARDFGLE